MKTKILWLFIQISLFLVTIRPFYPVLRDSYYVNSILIIFEALVYGLTVLFLLALIVLYSNVNKWFKIDVALSVIEARKIPKVEATLRLVLHSCATIACIKVGDHSLTTGLLLMLGALKLLELKAKKLIKGMV